jgi:hypothetical protein
LLDFFLAANKVIVELGDAMVVVVGGIEKVSTESITLMETRAIKTTEKLHDETIFSMIMGSTGSENEDLSFCFPIDDPSVLCSCGTGRGDG